MKKFTDYSDTELLTLDNESFNDSIRLLAIERGIKPPVTLPEALRTSEWRGYQKPAESVKVFQLAVSSSYGGTVVSELGFLDEATAMRALEGMVHIDSEGYGATQKWVIKSGTPTLQVRLIGVTPSESKAAKFVEFTQDNSEFDKVAEECVTRFSEVRQAAYNKRVNLEHKAEYLRLAQGNEEIAKGFWAKVEHMEWPSE